MPAAHTPPLQAAAAEGEESGDSLDELEEIGDLEGVLLLWCCVFFQPDFASSH